MVWNFVEDFLTIAESLIVHALRKKFVEIKMILEQKRNVTRLELERFVAQDFWVREDIGIERSRAITRSFCVPFEATYPNLERIHSCAVVF